MSRIHVLEFLAGQLLSRQVQLVSDPREEIPEDLDLEVGFRQPCTPKEVHDLEGRELPEHEQRRARSHVESSRKEVLNAREVDEKRTARLEDADRMVESRIEV